jgi:hypothetical protein
MAGAAAQIVRGLSIRQQRHLHLGHLPGRRDNATTLPSLENSSRNSRGPFSIARAGGTCWRTPPLKLIELLEKRGAIVDYFVMPKLGPLSAWSAQRNEGGRE